MSKAGVHGAAVGLFIWAAFTTLSQIAAGGTLYNETNLTSDGFVPAANIDANLKNPWGISFGPTTPFWVSDQAGGVSTLYTGTGAPAGGPLVVTIPAGGGPPSGPTGQVFNSGATTSFLIPAGTGTVRSSFLFDTLSGTIQGWNPGSTGGLHSAVIAATKPGAVYTGLAIANSSGSDYLYAANNAGAGSVDVYDSNFNNVSGTTFAGKFVDPNALPGFAPFNVQHIGDVLYVTYAHTVMGVPTPGGFVDEYDTAGNFIKRFASNGPLDAPWGITEAPSIGFGSFSGDILIGNFFPGGEINAFDPTTGALMGTIDGPGGTPITNDFLWALDFGNGGPGFSSTTLYLTAGLNNQKDGLFAAIQAVPEPGALGLMAAGLLAMAGAGARRRRGR